MRIANRICTVVMPTASCRLEPAAMFGVTAHAAVRAFSSIPRAARKRLPDPAQVA